MSWGRYPRLAGILIVGGLLTLVEGLAQQAQLAADLPAKNDNQQIETVDQPQEVARAVLDNGAGLKAETAKSVAEDATRATQPASEAKASTRMPEPPAALFLPNVDQLSPLDKAYLDAFSILRQDNTCSRFYGGSRVIEVLNELKKQLKTTTLDTKIAVRMSGDTVSVTSLKYGISYRLFDHAELNLRGSFYHGNAFHTEQSVPAVGGFSPNTREARVTILLHELGHLVQMAHQKWLLPNDGSDEVLSHNNTQQIIAVCGKQIRELSGARFGDELEAARPSLTGPTVEASVPR